MISIAGSCLANESALEKSISWELLIKNNILTHSSQCNIYSGSSGVILFYLELYIETKNEKYLNISIQGLNWVMQHYLKDEKLTKSFFTGSLGIMYVFHKAHSITNNPQLLEDAKIIFKYYLNQKDVTNSSVDLINGLAGEILGLLHVHSYTKEEQILGIINSKIGQLISRPILLKSGIAWENSIHYQKPLCGFSHGAGGIGWLFVELGNYFKNDSFFWLAEQTFDYEMSCYDKEKKNYPDYRASIKEEDYDKHCSAFSSGDLSHFITPSFFNAWCHGAAGIGLSRLRAYEILHKTRYSDEAIATIECTVESDINITDSDSLGLCHGNCGNAELFIEASNILDEKYIVYAEQIALRIINMRKKDGGLTHRIRESIYDKDISLFRGDIGIAYYLLRLYNNGKTPSILLPVLTTNHKTVNIHSYSILNSSVNSFKIFILEKIYPKTFSIIKHLYPSSLEEFVQINCDGDLVNCFSDFMDVNYSNKVEKIYDLFNYEKSTYNFIIENINNSLWFVKALTNKKKIESYKDDNKFSVQKRTFVLSDSMMLVSTKWDWRNENSNINFKKESVYENCYLMFFLSELGVKDLQINEFNYVLLDLIKHTPKIEFQSLVEKVFLYFECDDLNKPEISSFVRNQLLEFVKAGIITSNDNDN